MQIHRIKGKERIGIFDTEQSNSDMSKQVSYIKRLGKNKKLKDYLDFFTLKEHFSQEICKRIESYLKLNTNCGIVVIDGLIDMVNSMNDERESQTLMRMLLIWGKRYDVLFICIYHTGKGKEAGSLGHLGSYLERKSQSFLTIEKNSDGSRSLKSKFTRSSFEDFEDVTVAYNKLTGFFWVGEVVKLIKKPEN